MRTKYFNDGVVGNKKIKASFTKQGELIRLLYGSADYKQFLDFFHVGLKVNDSAILYLHNDINNSYSQEYVKDTNILSTTIFNSYFNLKVIQKDFVPLNENILIRTYTFENKHTIDLNLNLLVHSKIWTNLNNDTCGYVNDNALIQYNHDFSVSTFSTDKLLSYQINGTDNNISSGIIGGKDYIGMSSSSAISYDLNILKPGEKKSISLYIYVNKIKDYNVLTDLSEEIERIKSLDEKKLEQDTIKYWREYLKIHDKININDKELPQNVKKIYNRSILLFPLLINDKTGGISAGIEIDEDKTKCGRYAYCWPRDAVFVTEAFDIVGMSKESEKFYSTFCQMTQNKAGNWEQRFFTDGRLAPCWGYQIDETASVIYGIYSHYEFVKDQNFLYENLKMCENAISFLLKYVDDVLKEEYKMKLSYDLWEEFEGYTLYSLSSIYGAFESMIKMYNESKRIFVLTKTRIESINKQIEMLKIKCDKIKEYCQNKFYDENKKSYVRNNKDSKVDISMLGSVVPFNMFSSNDDKMYNTIERINMTLRTYTGGYIRYEDDTYMGGYNPWPIATLWMAWYYLNADLDDKAVELFNFVSNSASNHGLLGEQVNNDAMKPSWVIGLTWSHAMYLIILDKLIKKGLI